MSYSRFIRVPGIMTMALAAIALGVAPAHAQLTTISVPQSPSSVTNTFTGTPITFTAASTSAFTNVGSGVGGFGAGGLTVAFTGITGMPPNTYNFSFSNFTAAVIGAGVSDFSVTFTISVPTGYSIVGASLNANSSGSGPGEGITSIDESLSNSTGLNYSGPGPGSDAITFAGVNSLVVSKDVNASAGTGYFANISVFSEDFEVVPNTMVPEPGSIALLSVGVVGLFGYSLKRRKV